MGAARTLNSGTNAKTGIHERVLIRVRMDIRAAESSQQRITASITTAGTDPLIYRLRGWGKGCRAAKVSLRRPTEDLLALSHSRLHTPHNWALPSWDRVRQLRKDIETLHAELDR